MSSPATVATLTEIPSLAALGVTRVLVPVTGVAGLHGVIRGPADVLAWRETIERYAGT